MAKRTYTLDDYSPETQAAVEQIISWHLDAKVQALSTDRYEVADIIENAVLSAKKVTEEKVRAGCAAVAEAHLNNPKTEKQ